MVEQHHASIVREPKLRGGDFEMAVMKKLFAYAEIAPPTTDYLESLERGN